MASTTATTTEQHSNSYLAQLQSQGYVVVPSLLPPHLLLAAQASSKYMIDRARQGKWPYVRTVPKQYPPWPEVDQGSSQTSTSFEVPNIWGVQHLLHPDMPVRDVFAEIYFAPEILKPVKQLLSNSDHNTNSEIPQQTQPEPELVMELFNLLISPSQSQDFELEWHRDDVRPDVTPEQEATQLAEKSPGGRQLHAQYNIALFDDASLIVVPGSHRRVRTQVERDATPYQRQIEGMITVQLKPGDAVFYDSNILHRGVYKGISLERNGELGRATLHGSVGLAGSDSAKVRARQVLQHGVGKWIGKERARFDKIEDSVKRKTAEEMRERLIRMGSGEGLGYSLDG